MILTEVLQCGIEADEIWLHPDDGQSILKWVARLQEHNTILAFKSGADPTPLGSQLAPNAFVLIIQCPYQKEVFEKDGHSFAGIDATHNTTHYENMSLFTIIICD